MSSSGKEKGFFGLLYRICRVIWRVSHRPQPVYGLNHVSEQPAVFIGRHQSMYGPVEIMAWVPLDLRVWTLYKFMTLRDCYRHFSTSTFAKNGRATAVSRLKAAAVSPFVAAFIRSMGGLPVYRGCKNIIDTFRLSVEALKAGENLLIMPERDYQDSSSDAGELYVGFVHLAQMYYNATGKALHFFPVYPSKETGAIFIEKPIVFDPSKPFRAERDRVVEALKRELNHTVVESDFNVDIAGTAEHG